MRKLTPMEFLAWVGALAVAALIGVLDSLAIIAAVRAFMGIPAAKFEGVVELVIAALLIGVGYAIIRFLMTLPKRTGKSLGQLDYNERERKPQARHFFFGRSRRRDDDDRNSLGEGASNTIRHRIIEGTWGEPPNLES